MKAPDVDDDKFKTLIHYVVWHSRDVAGIRETDLYKVLWLAEAHRFVHTGRPIAGTQYVRGTSGPEPRTGRAARDELVDTNKIACWQDDRAEPAVVRLHAVCAPDTAALDSDELAEVNHWIGRIARPDEAGGTTTTPDRAWQLAELGAPLPFTAVLADRVRAEMPPEDRAWAERRAKELNLP